MPVVPALVPDCQPLDAHAYEAAAKCSILFRKSFSLLEQAKLTTSQDQIGKYCERLKVRMRGLLFEELTMTKHEYIKHCNKRQPLPTPRLRKIAKATTKEQHLQQKAIAHEAHPQIQENVQNQDQLDLGQLYDMGDQQLNEDSQSDPNYQ